MSVKPGVLPEGFITCRVQKFVQYGMWQLKTYVVLKA